MAMIKDIAKAIIHNKTFSNRYKEVTSSLLAPRLNKTADSFISSLYEAKEIIPIIIAVPIKEITRNTSIPTLAASTNWNNVSSIVKALLFNE